LEDPATKITELFVPGGGIEEGEKAVETAIRETFEETGYKVRVQGEGQLLEYPFTWNGTEYWCRTWFFKGELDEKYSCPQIVQDADYHKGVDWISVTELEKKLGFNKDILGAVLKLI
jgi:tRNA(adenine34) deaminase